MVGLSILLSIVAATIIISSHFHQTRDQLSVRGRAITHAICQVAEATADQHVLQRFVAAMSAEPGVDLIIVAAGDPLTVVASSRTQWMGMPASRLPDPLHTYRDLNRVVLSNTPQIEFEHDEKSNVDITVPLRTRLQSANPLTWSNGAVMLHIDGRTLKRQQARTSARLVLLLTVIIFGATATAYGLLSWFVLRPVKRIAHIARETADGERTMRVQGEQSDELGRLADDIDFMLDELVKRETLERRARKIAVQSQQKMKATLAELTSTNFALDQHAIVAVTDLAGRITHVNDKFCEISKYSRNELIGQTHQIINSGVHPRSFWTEAWQNICQGQTWQAEVCNRAKDGSLYWVNTSIVPYRDQSGKISKYVAIRADITERKHLEKALRSSQERFELAVRGANDGIWDWNIATDEVYYSPHFKELLGYTQDEFPDHFDSFKNCLHPEDAALTLEALQRHLDCGTPYDVTFRLRTQNDDYRWFRGKGEANRPTDGSPHRMAGSISDITPLKQIEEKLAHDALHDRLTGLPNRSLLHDRLEAAIARHFRSGRSYAVLFLDFDRFKMINDNLGHDAGDALLKQIAKRLCKCVRAVDSVNRNAIGNLNARLGGDEFVVLLEDFEKGEDAATVADRLLKVLAAPFQLGQRQTYSTASIGIVIGHSGYARADDVLRDADAAMYEAKRSGKACYVVFDDSMRPEIEQDQQLEYDRRLAIDARPLGLPEEPVVNPESG
jgi:diguanylate cyclase (GGDEF)-like protein/PAS domain S-box-containing protein